MGYSNIASRFNRELPFSLKCKVSGMQIKDIAYLLIKELQLPLTADEFLTEIDASCKELLPRAQILPHVFNCRR